MSSIFFYPSPEVKGTAYHNFMATSDDHDLDQELQGPVSAHITPIFPTPEKRHASTSLERPVRPLAPRKGSPRRETHIPRPRNPFMIFRSEYTQAKITSDVERDHRHISRIVGYLWNNMSEEDKSPYRKMAEQEKIEHQRKYPYYKFSPGTRASKPVRRKVKRNGQIDLARTQKVAELLKAGLQGRDLESAVKDIDFDGSSPCPFASDDSSTSSSPAGAPPYHSPDVRGWKPGSNCRDAPEALVFRSPLLAPSSLLSVAQARPMSRCVPDRPVMDSLKPAGVSPSITVPASIGQIPRNFLPSPTVATSSAPAAYHTRTVAYDCQFYAPGPYVTYDNELDFTKYHNSTIASKAGAYQDVPRMQAMYSQYQTGASSPGLYSDIDSMNIPLPLDAPSHGQYHQNVPTSTFGNAIFDPADQQGLSYNSTIYTSYSTQDSDPMNPLTWDPMQFLVTE